LVHSVLNHAIMNFGISLLIKRWVEIEVNDDIDNEPSVKIGPFEKGDYIHITEKLLQKLLKGT